ncbi:hypothetical protein ACO2Q7_11960 [Rathayibacter sp. KR2-224]|uniref:hypothetical protein n=1 Tax=Rathayibacter sp. KR2-224 TaxID=3400913 RepID=UPI003C0D62C7
MTSQQPAERTVRVPGIRAIARIPNGLFTMVQKSNGVVYFQSTQNRSLYLTGSAPGAGLTLQPSDNDAGSQDWQLVAQ